MDMNTNRNVKLMQVSSQVAERASSDGATIKQCQSAYRQSTKTTVTETYTNFTDKPKPTQYQRTAVVAEEAGTDGTTNVQCRSIDYDNMKTTVMKLPTDFVKFTEPTLSRVSPVVAKMAHTDGTRVMQYQSDDQNSMKTTNMQMPGTAAAVGVLGISRRLGRLGTLKLKVDDPVIQRKFNHRGPG